MMEFSREDLLTLYRNMVRGRRFDESLVELFAKGNVAGMWHSGIGQEAVGAGAATFLRQDDWLAITHRGITAGLAKGLDPEKWLAESLGRAGGTGGGKSRKCADRHHGILPSGGTIGSCFPIAAGAGVAVKRLGGDQAVVCLFGDGAAGRGTLHECMNLAAVWRLPVVWVCENNLYSITTHVKRALAAEHVADLAHGYGMPGVSVDGQDVMAIADAVQRAVERARRGEGPSLVECRTYRYREHGEGDIPTPYRAKEEVESWKKRDPIRLLHSRMLDEGMAGEQEIGAVDREVEDEVVMVVHRVMESPWPDVKEAFTNLYLD